MNLKVKTLSGVKWAAVSQFSRQLVLILTTVILARLLDPTHFGIFGMVNIVIGFAGIFRNLGTSAAIIQSRDLPDLLVMSLFWVNVAFGLLVFGVLFFVAPLVSSFFNEPQVTLILQVLSVGFFISGCSVLNQGILERNLSFKKLALVEMSATVLGAIVGITAALLGFGVWSLVFQNLAITFLLTLLLWIVSPIRLTMNFSTTQLRSVLKFSLNLTGFNFVNYFIRNADYLLIGKFLGAEALGFYTLAYRIMLYPLQSISLVLGRVMFPFFSRLQDDDQQFRNSYLSLVGAIALITFPMMGGVWALSREFILIAFGEKWLSVAPLLMILAPVGAMQAVGTTVGSIYQAKGRTDTMLRWGCGAGILVVISFVIGIQWGISGVAWSYLLVSSIIFIPGFMIPAKLINLKTLSIMKAMSVPVIMSILLVVYLSAAKYATEDLMGAKLAFTIYVASGIMFYLIINLTLNRKKFLYIISVITNRSTNK